MRLTHVFAATTLAVGLALAGCSQQTMPEKYIDSEQQPSTSSEAATPDVDSSVDPDTPTSWGPTEGEVAQAQAAVAEMGPAQLAGQVIVGRYFGTDPAEPEALVRDLHLAGVCVTGANVTDREQVLATTAAISAAHAADGRDWPAVIGVDEEGGSVAHLKGIAATYPAFQTAGVAIENDRARGKEVVRQGSRAMGLELRQLGFTWDFAPVADVTIGSADPTIGTRSAGMDPTVVADAARSSVTGFNEAGLVSTAKHFPGHGSATTDSHDELPVLDRTLDELEATDLVPFQAAIDAHAPAIMFSHLDVQALEPGKPASLAPAVYAYLRDEMGFEGVTITDSMGMGAVAGLETPAVQAINAGADLILMPALTAGTHGTITEAIKDGTISDERIRQAAARVVALQLWQQRMAAQVAVPEDAGDQAAAAAAAMIEAAS